VLTDIVLANKNNCFSILVTPFNNKNEGIGVGILRRVEKIILKNKITECIR